MKIGNHEMTPDADGYYSLTLPLKERKVYCGLAYMGKPIEECSREELIEAVKILADPSSQWVG